MSDELIPIEINGKPVMARKGTNVLQAADECRRDCGDADLYIPRYCYHEKLSVAANCRMCLVEVEDARGKSPKPMPACGLPVAPGLKIYSKSKLALDAQQSVMEFLLINHPLDCPVCEQAGQCELQDLAVGFGSDHSAFKEEKRSVLDENMGPLVDTFMTRCIQCTRCVRFSDEVDGLRELAAVNRGEHMEIRTFDERPLQSVVSGNIIDLCPVGALTSKPSRFTGRAWEFEARPSIAPHDCLGSPIALHVRRNEVMRTGVREDEAINEVWLSDRDRFAYEGLSAQRLSSPLVKINNQWKEVSWEAALKAVVDGLNKVIHDRGAEQVGVLASAQSTTEECFLLQKLARELGIHNIDYRLRQTDFRYQESMSAYPRAQISFPEMEQLDAALLIGSNIRHEQPLLSLRLRKAALKGAHVMQLSMLDHPINFKWSESIVVAPDNMLMALAGIAKAIQHQLSPEALVRCEKLFVSVTPSATQEAIANKLLVASKKAIIIGELAINHPHAADIHALASIIAKATDARLNLLSAGPNAAGAALAGLLPHRKPGARPAEKIGCTAQAMFHKPLAAYVLLNVDPLQDCANPAIVNHALKTVEFVVAITPYMNACVSDTANVILPSVPFSETSGTFVNAQGQWQSFQGAVKPFGDARPAWKILRVLGNGFRLNDFEYESSAEVLAEVKALCDHVELEVEGDLSNLQPSKMVSGLQRIAEVPIYSSDMVVRRAASLQKTSQAEQNVVRMNAAVAKSLNVTQGESVRVVQGVASAVLPVSIDARVPDRAVAIAFGVEALGESFGLVTVERN